MAGSPKKQKPRVQASRQTQVRTPIPTAKQLRELIRVGQHAKAIDLATAALAAAGLTVAKKVDLLDLRAESFIARGEFDLASADVDSMLVLAKRARNAAFRERAQKRRDRVQARRAEGKAASNTASTDLAQENARLFDETQRLLKETEQRAAELAVINRIQEGMAAELDFQAIVDLVGDKLREVFKTGDMGIVWHDAKNNLLHPLYVYEHGVRLMNLPLRTPAPDGSWVRISRTRLPLVLNNRAEKAALGMTAVPGTDDSLSAVRVPILGSDRVLGTIDIESFERENAFGESEVRLLSTVAASMGVALENARLFDETQRLLKETEQRAAELAVINRIQEGMAAELDFQAIVDLVGDKLREVFQTGDIGIRWYDAKANLIHYLYQYEHGVRLRPPPTTPRPDGPWFRMVETRKPLVVKDRAEYAALGFKTITGTDQSRSSVEVPILGSDRVLGTIVLENYERENAFGEAEVRLLSTVAASMGVALENARLFDETQRLLKETEQRAAELAVINSIQEGMAAELDFQAIIDLVGDKLREVFQHRRHRHPLVRSAQPNLIHYPVLLRAWATVRPSPSGPLGGQVLRCMVAHARTARREQPSRHAGQRSNTARMPGTDQSR